MQINRDNTREIENRVDYDYKVGDKVMFTNHTAYKYETSYTGPFVITQYFTNVTENFKYGGTQIKYNIRLTIPKKLDSKVEYFNPINISDRVNI